MEWEREFVFDLNVAVKNMQCRNILSFEVRSCLRWSRDFTRWPAYEIVSVLLFPKLSSFRLLGGELGRPLMSRRWCLGTHTDLPYAATPLQELTPSLVLSRGHQIEQTSFGSAVTIMNP